MMKHWICILTGALLVLGACTGRPAAQTAAVSLPTTAAASSPTPDDAPKQEMQPAEASIRAMRQIPDLPLTFQGESSSPNAHMQPASAWMDAQGGQYLVDKETFQVLEYASVSLPGMTAEQTLDELRAQAEQLALQQSAAFARGQSQLTYSESSKDGASVAFRWEDPGSPGAAMPPLLQVVLRADGVLLHYINSLDVSEG